MAAFTLMGPDGPIEFREVHPASPSEVFGVDNARVERQYFVPWEQRLAARVALLGTTVVELNPFPPVLRFLKRTPPHRDLESPWLLARNVTKIEGVRPLGGYISGNDARGNLLWPANFEDAKITVTYEQCVYDTVTDRESLDVAAGQGGSGGLPCDLSLTGMPIRYVYVDDEPSAEFRTLRGGAFHYEESRAAGTPPPARTRVMSGTPLLFPTNQFIYHWLFVPENAFPFNFVRDTIGKCNRDPFHNHASTRLLLTSAKYPRCILPDGTKARNAAYTMRYFPFGANAIPRPGVPYNNDFYNVSNSGLPQAEDQDPLARRTPYALADFTRLFKPGN